METLLESIRIALSPDATDASRAAAAQACRTILTTLETKPGEQMTLDIEAPSEPQVATEITSASTDAAQIANMIGALRGIPVDQLLDLAIARMRAALPKGVEAPRVEPLKFHIIQIPRSTGGSK